MAIIGFSLITALGLVAASGMMRFAFPLGAFAVGAFLYFRYPIFYVSFSWWIWFLTPLLARIVDFKSGWDAQRLMLVSPFLVTLLSGITLIRYLPKAYRQGGLPFILVFVAVLYGFSIGLVKNSPMAAIRASLDWFAPILFGFHLFIHWRDYPKLSKNIQQTFLWGVLVSGVYGVVQYLVAPMWDRFWIIETELVTNGRPEPLGIRVFSTMHSPFPFAVAMMAGLVLLFNCQSSLRIPASVGGYLAFLLSSVRAAWGGWLVALLTLLTSMKARLQRRLIITILVMAVCIVPLATIEPFSEVIEARLQSFSSIQQDTSANDRAATYEKQLSLALSDFLGKGLGGMYATNSDGQLEMVILDSGVLDLFFTLGWLGAIPYLGGIALILYTLLQNIELRLDAFATAARAISIGVLVQMPLGNTIASLAGMVFWCFVAMCLAARNYYQQQRRLNSINQRS
jgi:hypothetical protein